MPDDKSWYEKLLAAFFAALNKMRLKGSIVQIVGIVAIVYLIALIAMVWTGNTVLGMSAVISATIVMLSGL